MNRRLNTKLYASEYDRTPDGSFLILRGVRQADVSRLLEEAMGLQGKECEIAYYLDLERFMVLAPHEAHVLADALGGDPTAGRGRLARKHWLVKVLEVPVRIGARAVRNARLTIYRIDRGATAEFKVEIALKGRRQNRTHFQPSDIAALDAALEDLVKAYGLHPLPKPERWEPRKPPQWRRDERLACSLSGLPSSLGGRLGRPELSHPPAAILPEFRNKFGYFVPPVTH